MKVRDKEARLHKKYLKTDRCNMYPIGKFWRDVNEVGIIVKFSKALMLQYMEVGGNKSTCKERNMDPRGSVLWISRSTRITPVIWSNSLRVANREK